MRCAARLRNYNAGVKWFRESNLIPSRVGRINGSLCAGRERIENWKRDMSRDPIARPFPLLPSSSSGGIENDRRWWLGNPSSNATSNVHNLWFIVVSHDYVTTLLLHFVIGEIKRKLNVRLSVRIRNSGARKWSFPRFFPSRFSSSMRTGWRLERR